MEGILVENATFTWSDALLENVTDVMFENVTRTPKCRDVNNVNDTYRCEFVRNTSDCKGTIGYLGYTEYMYCLFGPQGVSSMVSLSVLWLLVLFAGLGITANDFLCPALFIISKSLRMSQNVAGVTLLAFGNGSPDIFSAIAGIQQGKTDMVIGGLIGGGIFVTTVVAGSIFLTQSFTMMKRPFLRDVMFYMGAGGWAFYLFYSGAIYVYHAIGFIILYITYIVVVVASRLIHQKAMQMSEKAREAAEAEEGLKIKGDKDLEEDSPETFGVVLTSFFKYRWDEDRRRTSSQELYYYDNQVFAISLPDIEDDETPPPGYDETSFKAECCPEDITCEKQLPEPEVKQWSDFVEKVCPVNLKEWSSQVWWERILDIFKSPVMFLLLITTPVVDYKSPRNNWCRILNSLHCITGPVFITLATGYAFSMVGGKFPVVGLVFLISATAAALVYFKTETNQVPRFHTALAYLGFGVAVVWIYCIANEIVVLLQAVGIVFNLSDSILGLTILAWGNCLLDFLSNLAVARKGFPRMGIAACFGAPFLTLLLGVGVPCTIELMGQISGGPGMQLIFSRLTKILFATLAISLLSSLATMTVFKFQVKRFYGYYLIGLYSVFLIVSVLAESKVF